jgi:hypothetical protein
MTSIQAKFAVFYGTVDQRPSGWYWTGAPDDLLAPKGPITGPFETKADRACDAERGEEVTLTVFGCARVSVGQKSAIGCKSAIRDYRQVPTAGVVGFQAGGNGLG